MSDELKPCPFHGDPKLPPIPSGQMLGCAEEMQTEHDVWAYAVRCYCGAQGPECGTEAEAIAAWNQRTGDAQMSDDRVEMVARAMAEVIARRHGHERTEDWLNDERREEARAAIEALSTGDTDALGDGSDFGVTGEWWGSTGDTVLGDRMSVPTYDKCDTYVAGQYMFNYLRTFLACAGIDASKCKVVVELPDRDTQRQLVSTVQRESKGPPRSAGKIGNHSGIWQGVEYEFSVKGWNDRSRQFGYEVADTTPQEEPTPPGQVIETVTDDQIKRMVNRFLAWELPRDFGPDHGISFKNPLPHLPQHWPVGTNLFSYTQAEAMVRHMIEGLSE